ncbi:MAG: hypothetical protein JW830_07705 [Bacteroidales bacterium]|nr:hypothetical protein [Bacteroidales bacterium]
MDTEKLFERDDEFKRLIREEGLLTTAPDFTQRVMQMVRESDQKSLEYKPLLSRKAWYLLVTFTISLVLAGWLVLSNENPVESGYTAVVKPVWDFLSSINLSIHLSSGVLLIATIAIASIGLLLSLDIFLSRKYREASS